VGIQWLDSNKNSLGIKDFKKITKKFKLQEK
jgi:hypothetical protein